MLFSPFSELPLKRPLSPSIKEELPINQKQLNRQIKFMYDDIIHLEGFMIYRP